MSWLIYHSKLLEIAHFWLKIIKKKIFHLLNSDPMILSWEHRLLGHPDVSI